MLRSLYEPYSREFANLRELSNVVGYLRVFAIRAYHELNTPTLPVV